MDMFYRELYLSLKEKICCAFDNFWPVHFSFTDGSLVCRQPGFIALSTKFLSAENAYVSRNIKSVWYSSHLNLVFGVQFNYKSAGIYDLNHSDVLFDYVLTINLRRPVLENAKFNSFSFICYIDSLGYKDLEISAQTNVLVECRKSVEKMSLFYSSFNKYIIHILLILHR